VSIDIVSPSRIDSNEVRSFYANVRGADAVRIGAEGG